MTKFPTAEEEEEVAALVLRQAVEWQYRHTNLVVGYTNPWTFILPFEDGPLTAFAVHGPTFVELDMEQTRALRQHMQSVNEYSLIPVFRP